MKRLLIALLAALWALPSWGQIPGGGGIAINQTVITGGTNGLCLYQTSAGRVGEQACGSSGPYVPSTPYAAGNIVLGSDGNFYEAIGTTTGNDPTASCGTNWQLYAANVATTISVPTRCANLSVAMSFVRQASCYATLTLQVDNGQYAYGTTTTSLNSTCGRNLQVLGDVTTGAAFTASITGNTSLIVTAIASGTLDIGRAVTGVGVTPGTRITAVPGGGAGSTGTYTITSSANVGSEPMKARSRVIITSAAVSATNPFFSLSSGTLGLFDGFSLVGPGNSLQNYSCVGVYNGAVLIGGENVSSQICYFPLYTANAGYSVAKKWVVSGGGDSNAFFYNGGGGDVSEMETFGANTFFAQSGLLSEHGGAVFALSINSHHNGGQGVFVSNMGTINLAGSTIANNSGYAIKIVGGGSVDDTSVSFSTNALGNRFVDGNYYSSQSEFWGTTSALNNMGWAGPAVNMLDAKSTTAGAYDGLVYRQLSTTGVAVTSMQNSSGNDVGIYIGSTSQIIRNAFGLGNGANADLTANATPLGVGTFGNFKVVIGTNNAERVSVPGAGGFVVGTAALNTNATDGFLYIPTTAGTPIGTPSALTGRVPMVYDTSANVFWFYAGGAWKQPKTPAGAAVITWQ